VLATRVRVSTPRKVAVLARTVGAQAVHAAKDRVTGGSPARTTDDGGRA
jgi:hypothetical protein